MSFSVLYDVVIVIVTIVTIVTVLYDIVLSFLN